MTPPVETICIVCPSIGMVICCSMTPPFIENEPVALPSVPRSSAIVPEPALTMAAVILAASSPSSTVAPASRPEPAELAELEADEVVLPPGSPPASPQALIARAVVSARAASGLLVFTGTPHQGGEAGGGGLS